MWIRTVFVAVYDSFCAMKLILLLSVLCGAFAKPSPDPGWIPGQKYEYIVRTRSLASNNEVGNQYVGVVSQAEAEMALDRRNPKQLNVRIKNARFAQVHAWLSGGWDSPLTGDNKPNWQELKLQHPYFAVLLNQSVVTALIVNKRTSVNETNYYRSIASQLTVNLNGNKLVTQQYHQAPSSNKLNAYYSVMEDSLLGQCQTLYDRSQIPLYLLQYNKHWVPFAILSSGDIFLQVVKTTNFSNCDPYIFYHNGEVFENRRGSSAIGLRKSIQRFSNSHIIIEGTPLRYTLHSSVTINQMQAGLYEFHQKSLVYSKINMTLFKVVRGASVTSPLELVRKEIYHQMIPMTRYTHFHTMSRADESTEYTRYNTDERISDASSASDKDERNTLINAIIRSFSSFLPLNVDPTLPESINHFIQNIKILMQSITSDLNDEENVIEKRTLDKFGYVVNILQNIGFEELKELTRHFYVSREERVSGDRLKWNIFRDAVAQTGSGPSLQIINFWIEKSYVSSSEASDLIKVLPQAVQKTTWKYIKYFFEEMVSGRHHQELRLQESTVMSFSNLLHRAVLDEKDTERQYPVQAYQNITDNKRALRDTYVPWFAARLQNAIEKGNFKNVLLYIRALGNVADPTILKVFGPSLKGISEGQNGRTTIFQRMAMMMALNKMADVYPEEAQAVAYNVYQNSAEAYEVRVAAILVIMNTNPPADMLQRMAQATNFDASPQVVSATCSAIKAAAELEDPDMQELASNAQAAIRLLNPKPMSLHYSRSGQKDNFHNLGYSTQWHVIGSDDHIIPKTAYLKMDRFLHGMKLSSIDFSVMVSSITKLINVWQGLENNDECGTSLTNILDHEGVNLGPCGRKPFEAQLQFLSHGYQTFMTLDEQDIADFKKYLTDHMFNSYASGEINYHRLYLASRFTYAVPDTTGNLAYFSHSEPRNMHIFGYGDFLLKTSKDVRKFDDSNFLNTFFDTMHLKTLNLNLNISMKFAGLNQDQIGLINYYDETPMRYLTSVDKNIMIHFGTKMNIASSSLRDINERSVSIKLEPVNSASQKIFQVITETYTTYQNALEDFPPALSNNKLRVYSSEPRKCSARFGPKDSIQYNIELDDVFIYTVNSFEDKNVQDMLYKAFSHAHSTINHFNNITITMDPQKLKSATFDIRFLKKSIFNHSTNKNTAPDTDEYLQQYNLKILLEHLDGRDVYEASVNYNDGETMSSNYFQLLYNYSIINTDGSSSTSIDSQTTVIHELNITSQADWSYMPLHYFYEVSEFSPNSNIYVNVTWLDHDAKESTNINAEARLERTLQRMQYLTKDPCVQQCIEQIHEDNHLLQAACRNATLQLGYLDYYQVDATYDYITPDFINKSYTLYNVLQNMYWPYVQPNFQYEGEPNKIQFMVKFTPNKNAVNVRINTPQFAVAWNNVTMSNLQSEIVSIHPSFSAFNRIANYLLNGHNNPKCILDTTLITTFDNRTHPLQIPEFDQCWHLMMTHKHWSVRKENNITILIRNDDNHARRLRVIVGENVNIVMTDSENELHKSHYAELVAGNTVGFQIQGEYRQYTQRGPNATLSVIQSEQNVIKVLYSPHRLTSLYLQRQNVRIVFDGKRMIIYAPNKFRNGVHGMCGAFTDEDYTLVRYDPSDYEASSVYSVTECSNPETQDLNSSEETSYFFADNIRFSASTWKFGNCWNSCTELKYNSFRTTSKSGLRSISSSNFPFMFVSSFESSSSGSSTRLSKSSSISKLCSISHPCARHHSKSSSKEDMYSSGDSSYSRSSDEIHFHRKQNRNEFEYSEEFIDKRNHESKETKPRNNSFEISQNVKNTTGEKDIHSGQNKSETCSQMKVKVYIQNEGKLYCFSKRELLHCIGSCEPQGLNPIHVHFHCIGKSFIARYWAKIVNSGVKFDLSAKRTTNVVTLMVPEKCE